MSTWHPWAIEKLDGCFSCLSQARLAAFEVGGMAWSWGTHPQHSDLTFVSNHSYPGASSPINTINLDLRMLNSTISQLIISLLLLHIYCVLLPSIHLSMGRPGRISHHGNTYRNPPVAQWGLRCRWEPELLWSTGSCAGGCVGSIASGRGERTEASPLVSTGENP